MKKVWPWMIALFVSIQLTGCGTASESQTSVEAETSTTAVVIEESMPALTMAPTPEPSNGTPPVPATPSDEKEKLTAQYRMNAKTYRFEPIDEGTTDKAVLLTFDDGPKDEAVLTNMLDTLDRHGAKAIFFVNGYRVKQHPELLQLIHERGQTIGNHSYDHIDLKKEAESAVEDQLASVQKDVEALTGVIPRFFRPPYGSGNEFVKQTAKKHGLLYMTWSNGSLDWDKSAKNKPEVVIANVLEQLHPGSNILMHELEWTADALDELLGKLKDKGYSFIDPGTIELTS